MDSPYYLYPVHATHAYMQALSSRFCVSTLGPGIDVLFGRFGLKMEGPGLPGGSTNYQGHLFFQKGHL